MEKDWLALNGKSVVITGGATGLGYAIANAFLKDGACVTVCDIRKENPGFEYADDDHYLYVNTDVTSRESVCNMVKKAVEKFGVIDILVNNAGISIPSLLISDNIEYEINDAIWDQVMNVNLKGVFICTQEVCKVMNIKNRGGVIINISSECGLEGSAGQSVYAASKGAVNALTRSWAKELGGKNIRVVGIAPGILEATGLRTEAYESALAYTRGISVEKLRNQYTDVSSIPLGREGKLREVASVVEFAASDKSGYVDGVTINVAGGRTRG